MKKTISLLLVLLAFISVISPTACAIGTAACSAAISTSIDHPALWGDKVIPIQPPKSEESNFDGRVILIVVVALMGIIVSTALILLNVKYSKIRKEEEEEEAKKNEKPAKKE